MKKKIRFYKSLLIEIIETLCSICLYLEMDNIFTNHNHNKYGLFMRSHFNELKEFSTELRRGVRENE